ncbi:MAG: hypothetical protein LKM30_02355 [Bacilli bacterium]|jgi:hypothetical protein|nr:hypothetical protein [Bacilli bacterium]
MEFCKAMDSLPKIAKILIAIFLPIIYIIYRIIADVSANATNLILWDILFGIFPIPFIFWIMNLIYIISKDQVFSFAEWFGGAKAAEAKPEEKK